MFARPQGKCFMVGKKTRIQDSQTLELYLISLAAYYCRYVDTAAHDPRLKEYIVLTKFCNRNR